MTVYNLAQGGLGNRLLAMQSAIYMSKLFETKLIVCWPVNDECGIAFHKLFDTDIEEVEYCPRPDKGFIRLGIIPPHITEYSQFDDVTPILFDRITETDQFLNSVRHVDIYFSDWDTRCFTTFSPLKFKDEYIQKANDFVLKNNISATLHIRGTDSVFKDIEEEDIARIIHNRGNPLTLFVCSDEKAHEDRIVKGGPNRVARQDKEWPTKKDDSKPFLIAKGEYNVHRSEQVVVDAVIDMIVMSKTPVIFGNLYSSLAKYAHLMYREEHPGETWRYIILNN
jgi:hypothetical protein